MDEHKGVWVADKESIVNSIVEIAEEYDDAGDNLTLRQLYYQLVARDIIPNHDKVYKKISSIKDDVVYAGLVDWDIFEDRGRKPVNAYYEEDVSDALQRTLNSYVLHHQKGQPIHIEVWTEKDAISGILRKVTLPYTISLVINKGYNSSTAMYEAYNRFCQKIEEGKKVSILYFGDHDPSGLDMIRDIRDRLMFMFVNGERRHQVGIRNRKEDWQNQMLEEGLPEHLEEDESLWDLEADSKFDWVTAFFKEHFEIIQVGLTMEQIRRYNPPHNPAKITDPRAKDYIEQFGQVSWEVDALSPQVMRDIVDEAIKTKMDYAIYESVLEKESQDREKLRTIIEDL
jgi:hypothetical protein